MSTAQTPPILAPDAWQGIFSLARKENEDRQLLEKQLQTWCKKLGVGDAALYAGENGDSFHLHVKTGQARFPQEVPSDTAKAQGLPPGCLRVELPEAMLLHTSQELSGGVSKDPELLLMAAGARISTLKRQIHAQSFQARFRGVELESLYEVGLAIASTLDMEELGEEVLLRAISLLDARRGALFLIENGRYQLFRAIGGEARGDFATDEEHVAGLLAGEDQGSEGWLLPGAEHLLAVPIDIEGDARGLLVVADKESRRGVGPFVATDQQTLSLLANQAAIAIENAKLHKLALEKERLEREMELAAEIQKQLLPKSMPEIPGFEVMGWNRPARQVGGDYFDVPRLENGTWGMIVGDVTGKGMPAALLVSTLHSALRLLLDRMEVGPQLIERLNRHIHESSGNNKFITMLLATIDSSTHSLTYLNAGHNPGLLLGAEGRIHHMSSAGLPLGLMPDVRFGATCLHMDPGDLVCIYSDGITECESPDEEEFGLDRLIEVLQNTRERPLPDVIQAIDQATTAFAQGRSQGDDQTLILLRRS